MEFEIRHVTNYRYAQPVAEAYIEARLRPPQLATQKIISHRLEIEPSTKTSTHTDYFGNVVDFFSLPYRHKSLRIVNHMVVQTTPPEIFSDNLDVTAQEARQIFSSAVPDLFEYLQPTDIVQTGAEALLWAKRFFRGDKPLRTALPLLNEAIHSTFAYKKGSTDNNTPLRVVWKQRQGVCQDFAHLGLSVLRTAGLPSRYVCGYIEAVAPEDMPSTGPRALVGAYSTHAWVEVLVPGMKWVALDPTNNQWCGDRHIAVSFGRDNRDATPLRGTFKGGGKQQMEAKVYIKRRKETAKP